MKVSQLARKVVALTLILSAFATSAFGPPSVPEIDPGSIGSALTMLAGGLMLFRGRRSK